jgi:hypothetical protein
MSGRLIVTSGLLSISILLGVPAVVTAAPGGGGSTGDQTDGVISAGITYSSDGGGSSGGDGCAWRIIDNEIGIPNEDDEPWPRTQGGVTYHIWERRCPGDRYPSYFEVPEAQPADLLPALLERLKSRELPDPEPVFAQLDPTHGWAYVTVPVDFRAGGDSWRTVSVTANYGPVWATVTAQPSALRFDPGDPAGEPVAPCAGDGPIAGYDAATPGLCSYTYVNASSTSPFDGYHFMTSMTIDWVVSWTSSSGAGGPLDGYSTSGSAPLAVAEVQGVVTCTGSRSAEGGC